MEINSKQAYSILGFIGGENGAMISKTGIITVAFMFEQPEAYSLHSSDLDHRHKLLCQAFRNLTDETYVHKQDIFLKKKYAPEEITQSFIEKAQNKHFCNREYLDHKCILAFSIGHIEDLEKSYVENPLSYNEKLSQKSKERISMFLSGITAAINIIKSIHGTSIRRISAGELKEYIFSFVNGFSDDNGMRDIHFAEKTTIGEKNAAFFAICNEEYLPQTIDSFVPDNTLPEANSTLYMSKLERLGIHLSCNHVFNQIIWLAGNDKLKTELDNKVTVFGQHQQFSIAISTKWEKLKEMQKEVVDDNIVLCRAHFNVMIWDSDKAEFDKAEKKVKEILDTSSFKYYMPSFEGSRNIFIGNIIGRENKLDSNYYFLTDLDVALCMTNNYTTFRSDDEGILFNDRIFQIPLRKDIWDAKRKRIPARNGIVVAGTGGGKSSCTLNIVQQMLEQGYKVIVCEFGKSFEQLTHLYPGISRHIDYDGKSPLGINPFDLHGKELDIEKQKTLVNLIIKFWRSKEIRTNQNQQVSITKILSDYYEHRKEHHSFPDFYLYVKENYKEIEKRQEIPDEFFDLKSFLHVCSEFMPGGIYDNVCKISEDDTLLTKNFIVFELTKVKKDPFLASLIMSILFDTIENKILADKTTRGMLIFDEYAESQAMVDTFSGDDIHSTVAFCYQKLRKENGAVMTIIQAPAQLPDNNYTKGIISNTQLLYVLPSPEVIYNQVIQTWEIENEAQRNLMRSIRNNFSGIRPYSEIYIRFMDLYNIVVRLEFSREKFYAFQTDGEDWQAIHNSYALNGNMEQSINDYITLKHQEYAKTISI